MKPKTLREALKGKLSKKELKLLITSFDIIGGIAVIEIAEKLESKAKLIGETLLSLHKNLETIAMIKGKHQGIYRVQPLKIIAGRKSYFTLYKESNSKFKVKVNKVFFSPRLSFERQRISKLIKKGEVIGAFFAGVGPYPIVFAKNSLMREAVAIELNPVAFELLKENIKLNKLEHKIKAVYADVSKIVPRKFKNYFDRIVMPLPEGSKHFLDAAFTGIKDKGVIHFYAFVSRSNPFTETINLIKRKSREFNCTIRILNKKQVRSFSPSKIQVVIDFKVFKKISFLS